MKITTISDIKLPITAGEEELLRIAEKRLHGEVKYLEIKKKSLDARDKNNMRYVYTIACSKEAYREEKAPIATLPKERLPEHTVLVVGSGPAGLFCALKLLERGIMPTLIERGAPVEERERDIQGFFTKKILDEESNIQFGEGGAGTFSDGKLNTQTHSAQIQEVLETFVRFGAPKEITYLSKPHLGSDKLKGIVKNMREYILAQGGKVLFHTRFEDFAIKDGVITEATLRITDGTSVRTEKIPVSAVVLAIGHSARDTFALLQRKGVVMRPKNFAVGVRIEHLQEKIGFAQYGKAYSMLPTADYKLVSHASDRAAFTFCMCPGGFVMPSASEKGGVVVNGMSNYARDGINANSALIAQVSQADFEGEDALAGVRFQQKLERLAYTVGGEDYSAPVQLVGDFLKDKVSAHFGEVLPTYAAGTKFAKLNEVLPEGITNALKCAIVDMDRRLKGFAHPEAVLTGVESRTSSPVRIERSETLEAIEIKGLYPCGEGAGYAGGITSAAVDGIRTAEAIYGKYML